MKNILWLILLAIVLTTLGFSSCKRINEVEIAFDSVTIDRQIALSTDSGSPQCKVHIHLMYANDSNKKASDSINKVIINRAFNYANLSIRQAIDSFANKYMNDYKSNLCKLYNADKDNKKSSKGWYDYSYVLTSTTEKGNRNVVMYFLQLESYEGGAHSVTTQQLFNFDTRTGKELTINDIFVPGYKQALNDILLKSLEDKTDSKDIRELHRKGYLLSSGMFASDNFMFNDGNITFYYNPDEIAPYALGSIELTISDSDMKNILKYYPK